MEKSPHENQDGVEKGTDQAKARKPEKLGFLAVETKMPAQAGEKSLPAKWLESVQKAPEHIGHVLVSVTETEPKQTKQKSETARNLNPEGKRVSTLGRAELLLISEQIIIDGSSLRQIYETHLVGERGLRRLVEEYLEGGDVKKQLKQEIVDREVDFERDPILRDFSAQSDGKSAPGKTSTGKQKTALDDLLARADTSVAGNSEEAAFFKARARFEAEELKRHKQRRVFIDIALAATIALLIILVIVLYISRK